MVVVLVLAGAVGGVLVATSGPSTEDDYLSALAEAGLDDEFSTDRAAVRNAEERCDGILDGGDPQGSEADLVGVEFYCGEFADDFAVLEVIDVEGSFTIIDADSASNSLGGGCSGDGGYGDINSSTQVIVTDGSGEILTRTELGPGSVEGTVTCRFTFEFTITEGEELYVVEVGDRGGDQLHLRRVEAQWSRVVDRLITMSTSFPDDQGRRRISRPRLPAAMSNHRSDTFQMNPTRRPVRVVSAGVSGACSASGSFSP
ncbi:MAG: hypothetical protein U5K30_05740 [Acidimicrobiales bacterium]|nr:hypothetical protein [Acidimicrobiales bacterium]